MSSFGGKTVRIVIFIVVIIGGGFVWGFSKKTQKNLSVCEVQGSDDISPYSGSKVILQGIVIADLEGQIPAGFFIMDQNCPDDEKGSQGIFIQHGVNVDIVHLGDRVETKGLVQETAGETRILSDPEEIEILSLGNELPPGINLAGEFLLDPVSFQYEQWEGMLVSFPDSEFLDAIIKSDPLRILPLFDLDSSLQMICLQGRSIALQLSGSERIPRLKDLSNGDKIRDLSGILRQNTTGYLLELITEYDYSLVVRKTSPEMPIEGSFAVLTQSGTEGSNTPGTTPGTLSVSQTITSTPAATTNPLPTWYPVHLLFSEFLPNPSGKEPDGEWIEIYNPEQYGQPLTGIKIGDETSRDGKEGMLRFPDGYYIEGKEVLVVAQQAEVFFSEYGFLPDFEMEGSDTRIPDLLPYDAWGRSRIQFSNSGDEVVLLDPWDGIVDLLVYGNSKTEGFSGPPPAPHEGHSLERYPPDRDRDRGADWRERDQVSPGRLDRSPPTQPATMTLNPSYTLTSSPQPSQTNTASLTQEHTATSEWTVSPTTTPDVIPTQSPSITITLTVTSTPEPSLSPTPSKTPSPSLTKSNEITLTTTISPSSTNTPQFATLPAGTDTPTPGTTLTISPVGSETHRASSTPSQVPSVTKTLVYLEDQEILLNEIHADPDLILGDANNDGQVSSDDDEFIEFVNIKGQNLDLSGWSISDTMRIRFIFPDGSILGAGCAVVVFGGGDPGDDFGGSQVFIAGSLGLNNPGDSISLKDSSGEERLYYQYGLEGGENQSLTRSPDISGNLPLVLHSELAGSLGALYSPGMKIDGSVFGVCP